jgi:hypothetical protein
MTTHRRWWRQALRRFLPGKQDIAPSPHQRQPDLFMMRVTADRHLLTLSAQGNTSDERALRVWVDGAERGVIAVSAYSPVGATFNEHQVAVWGGTRLYIAPLGAGPFQPVQYDEPIDAVYSGHDCWLIVAELSVALLTLTDGSIRARYDHHEILIAHQWMGDRLLISDLEGRRLTFRPFTTPGALHPASA